MRLFKRKPKVQTLPKSAGVCTEAYGKQHVIMPGVRVCLLCREVV